MKKSWYLGLLVRSIFDKFTDESGAPKAKCKYCGKIYVAARKGNGTMTMDNHLLNKYPKFIVL